MTQFLTRTETIIEPEQGGSTVEGQAVPTPATEDATRYVTVKLHIGDSAETFRVEGVHGTEGSAQEQAKKLAEANEGAIYGVFQKVGTARLVRKVEWKGLRG